MALVESQVMEAHAPDGTTCVVLVTADDTTNAIDHITINNGTPLTATFSLTWKNNTFTFTATPHSSQTWTPTQQMKKNAAWLTDPIPFNCSLD